MRRRLLLAGLTIPLAARHSVGPAQATSRPEPPRRLLLRHAATGARFSGIYHDGRGVHPVALSELSVVLADSRTGTVHPFDPLALDILWEAARRARITEELVILSGYRTLATNIAVHGAGDSHHLRAGALDVHVAPARLPEFGDIARRMARGGVGSYAQRGFVHLDSGPVRWWDDAASGVPTGAVAARPDPLARMAEAWAATRGR